MNHIDQLKENIRLLKVTLKMEGLNEGYVLNCKADIASYEKRISELEEDNQPTEAKRVLDNDGQPYDASKLFQQAQVDGLTEIHKGVWLASGDYRWEHFDDFGSQEHTPSEYQCSTLWFYTEGKGDYEVNDTDDLDFLLNHPWCIDPVIFPEKEYSRLFICFGAV